MIKTVNISYGSLLKELF